MDESHARASARSRPSAGERTIQVQSLSGFFLTPLVGGHSDRVDHHVVAPALQNAVNLVSGTHMPIPWKKLCAITREAGCLPPQPWKGKP
jgi:hypothetical protein